MVLNDNEMSIAHNVGAISKMLDRVRTDPRYHRAKEDLEQVMQKLPMGGQATQAGRRVLHGIKALVLPNLLWEELGFTFVGAVDGHNLEEMEEAFDRAKEYIKPTVIHVMTRKGTGLRPSRGGLHQVARRRAQWRRQAEEPHLHSCLRADAAAGDEG